MGFLPKFQAAFSRCGRFVTVQNSKTALSEVIEIDPDFYRCRSLKRSREYEEATSNTKPKLSTDSNPRPLSCTGNTDSRLRIIPKTISNAATNVTTSQSGLVTTSLLSRLQPGSVDIVQGDLKQPKILSVLNLPEHILASSPSVVFSLASHEEGKHDIAKVILHIPPVIVQYGDDQKASEHLPLVVRKDPRAFYQAPSVGIEAHHAPSLAP